LYKATELYYKVFQEYFNENFKLKTFCNNECFFIRIGLENDKYCITESYDEAILDFELWNDGDSIRCHLAKHESVNGNLRAIKFLEELKWQKNIDGDFERFGNSKLLALGDDYEENFSNAIEAIFKLFKNGLIIKLT